MNKTERMLPNPKQRYAKWTRYLPLYVPLYTLVSRFLYYFNRLSNCLVDFINTSFFPSIECVLQKAKPLSVKDYIRHTLLATGGEDFESDDEEQFKKKKKATTGEEEEEDEEELSIVQQQAKIKREFLSASMYFMIYYRSSHDYIIYIL